MAGRRSTSKKRSASRSKRPRPEPLVFFLDRSVECATIVTALEKAGIRVHVHKNHFADDEHDEKWLPEVAQRGWLILTRDKRIRYRPIEKQAMIASGAKAFVLVSPNLRGQEMADVVVRQLRKIARIARNTNPPFIAAVSRTGVRMLDL